jgi:3-oxosteroid 1-dehydrogenase
VVERREEIVIDSGKGLPESWDEEFDFVVLGSGGAGAAGAIVAALEGARVVVLEKTEFWGGTTAVSGGGFWVPLNRHMTEVGVDDSREDALAYLRASAGGAGDDENLVALVDNGYRMVECLEDRAGCTFRSWPGPPASTPDYRPWLPGSRVGGRTLDAGKFLLSDLGEWEPKLRRGAQTAWRMDKLLTYSERHHILPPDPGRPTRAGNPDDPYDHAASGGALMGQLLKAALEQGVTISLETPARELLVEEGAVIGVRAERDGKPLFVRARHGVLIATGGFAWNEELKKLWLDKPLEFSCEIDENQGDGHLMAMAVGAQMANLGDAWWMAQGAGHSNRYVPHTLIVNRSGRRFVNEALNYYDFGQSFGSKRDGADGKPRNLPCWLVMDSQGTTKYSVLATTPAIAKRQAEAGGALGDVRTATRTRTPATRVVEAASLDELAAELGIDAGTFAETVERFNGYARTGIDEEFHRGEDGWGIVWGDPDNTPNPSLGTLEQAPFYAIEITPGALATRGGPRVNARAEVLSALTGEPIPGLYAAGNSSNCATPYSYPGPGSTVGAGMTYGYIAAMQVAARTGQAVGAGAESAGD